MLADIALEFTMRRVKELFAGDESVLAVKPELHAIVQTRVGEVMPPFHGVFQHLTSATCECDLRRSVNIP